jgi:type IV pilus assembly protein PilQ
MSKYGKLSLAVLTAVLLAGGAIQARTAEPAPGPESAALTSPQAADAPRSELRDVRVDRDASGRPTIVLSGSGPMAYETMELKNPQRLVIDLKDTVSKLPVGQVPVGSAGVQRVRAGQFRRSPEPVSRVVVDLDGPIAYHVEALGDAVTVAFDTPVAESKPEAVPAPAASAAAEPPATETKIAEAVAVSAPAADTSAPKAEEPAPVETKPVASSDTKSAAADSSPAATAAPTEAPASAAAAHPADAPAPTRALSAAAIDKLLKEPAYAAEEPPPQGSAPAPTAPNYGTQTIVTDKTNYSGKKISLNLVDTEIKQIFRLFHEISGLNFVLDPAVEGKVTIVLDNVPWDQALDIILKNNGLDKTLENNVIRIAPTAKLAAEAASRKQLKEAKDLEVEPITVTRTLSYAKAEEVEKVIRDGGVLSTRGKVIVDKRTNALIISDIPKKVTPLDQLISTLDSETPQVMIEARIVETSKSFSQDLGVVWGFSAIADASRGTKTNLAFPQNASVKYGLNVPGAGTASTLAFKFGNILDSFTLDIALSDLENEGRGRILSSPKIATQNNERAEIEQGVRIPVVTTTATEINVQFVSASLRLAVTPQITADGTVAMDVIVENNTPDFVNRVGDVPPINTQRAQTKILVADGGTAVIGGIFTVNEGQSEVGVPWFRHIPGLGWLFKTRNITNENRELLIFITPKIVKIG